MYSLATMVLVGGMLCIMAARLGGPFGQRAQGKPFLEHRLSFRERLLFHRHSLYAIGIVLLLGAATGAVPRSAELIGVLGAFAIVISVPAVYRATERGIALNGIVFREWGEFERVEQTRTGLRLVARPGMGAFPVICASAARDAVKQRIERALQRAA